MNIFSHKYNVCFNNCVCNLYFHIRTCTYVQEKSQGLITYLKINTEI